MGKICCIRHHRGGKRCGEGVILFSVPKATDLYDKWRDAIAFAGIVLKKTHYVCQKHFNPVEIMDKVTVRDISGKVLFQRQYQKVRLRKGAVPSIFETCNQSLPSENDNLLQIQETPDSTIPSDTHDPHVMDVTHERDLMNTDIPRTSTLSDIAEEEIDTVPQLSFFDKLHRGAITPKLPHPGWSKSIQNSPKLIVFAELGQLSTGTLQAPWSKKQITLDEQMNVQIFIFNKFARTATVLTDCNGIEQLENIICQVNELAVCKGGPTAMHYRNVQTRCAYKDMSNRWRHNLCTLTIEAGVICKSCATLDGTLRKHLACKKNMSKQHIPLLPSRKQKLDILRTANRVQAQAFKRSQRRLYKISREVTELHRKLAQVEETIF